MYCTLTTGFHTGKWVWDSTTPSKHTHIQHISPISLNINLLIFHAKASGHTPCIIYHTSPFGGELGLPESLSCLHDYRGSSIALGMPAHAVVSLHPAIKYIFWSWRVINLGWSLQLLVQLRSHLFKMEYYGGVGYFGEKFWSGYKCK